MGSRINNDKIIVDYGIDPEDLKQKDSSIYLKQERKDIKLHSDVMSAFFNGNDFSHDENIKYKYRKDNKNK